MKTPLGGWRWQQLKLAFDDKETNPKAVQALQIAKTALQLTREAHRVTEAALALARESEARLDKLREEPYAYLCSCMDADAQESELERIINLLMEQ